MKSVPRNLAGA